MLKKALLFAGVALILGACTIQEELTFNKNFSGTGSVSYNISMFGEDEENDSTLASQMELAAAYRDSAIQIRGIHNVLFRYDEDETRMIFTYQFDDLKALNALYKLQMFDEAPFMRKEFAAKGKKKLSVTWPVHELTEEDRAAYEEEMMDSYTYELTLNLPRESKGAELNSSKITHTTEGKVAKFSGEWGHFYTQTEPVVWKVKM
ncbi:MAG TPA: hypothetical protein P5228_05675 [Bacteroidales bacterium]|nr:hypothetical protein [Bacteroidales bacterium]